MPSSMPGVSRSQRMTMTGLAAVAAVIDLGELYWFGWTAQWLAVLAPAGAAFGASVIWRRTRPLAALIGACLGYLVAWVPFVFLSVQGTARRRRQQT